MSEQEWINIFGDNLRDFIDERGMTQRELADDSGLAESSISDYVNQRRMPTVRAIINLAYALDLSVEEFADFIDFGERIY